MKLKKMICTLSVMIFCMTSAINGISCNLNVKAADAKIEKAIEWAVAIANDDSHGYSQENRQEPDYDCSSLVVNALKYAGISTGGASYTGNMKSELTQHGFTWIPWSSINNVSNLQRGDILLRRSNGSGHTEIYLGNNQNVGAHSSRGNPQTGDQTGTEIDVCSYYYGNWTGVLRYNYSGDDPSPIVPSEGCFQACGAGYTSIVEALKSIGADSSYSYRAKIAAANGIANYSGTASQNTGMLDMLKNGTLKVPSNGEENNVPEPPPIVDYGETYFPACSSSYVSIADALKSIGIDSSYDNRKVIASANNISGYSGTVEQNVQMLNLLKQGRLINPNGSSAPAPDTSGKYFPSCSSDYKSITDALKSIGADGSYNYRKQIATKNNISNYSGTADQNNQMLSMLKSGTLIRPEYVEPPAVFDYKVTLDATSGITPIASMTIASNSTYKGLPTATREGYTFSGWFTSADGGSQITDGAGLASLSDHTLYAHWTANNYTVSFENNDGSGISSSKAVTFDSNFGELCIPKRIGYTFDGWYTDIADGTKVTSDSKYSTADNVTLYAHWKANGYNVSFDLNGGAGELESKTVFYDELYGELPNASKSGYNFSGWFTDDGIKIDSETLVTITDDQVLYAHWSEKLKLDRNSLVLENGDQFTINANQTNLTYKSSNTDIAVVSKTGIVTALDEGDVTIIVTNENNDSEELKVIVVADIIEGDCNEDGKISIADAVMLQKWLLNESELLNWYNADLCHDGKIDVFDMIEMRRKIIENM